MSAPLLVAADPTLVGHPVMAGLVAAVVNRRRRQPRCRHSVRSCRKRTRSCGDSGADTAASRPHRTVPRHRRARTADAGSRGRQPGQPTGYNPPSGGSGAGRRPYRPLAGPVPRWRAARRPVHNLPARGGAVDGHGRDPLSPRGRTAGAGSRAPAAAGPGHPGGLQGRDRPAAGETLGLHVLCDHHVTGYRLGAPRRCLEDVRGHRRARPSRCLQAPADGEPPRPRPRPPAAQPG